MQQLSGRRFCLLQQRTVVPRTRGYWGRRWRERWRRRSHIPPKLPLELYSLNDPGQPPRWPLTPGRSPQTHYNTSNSHRLSILCWADGWSPCRAVTPSYGHINNRQSQSHGGWGRGISGECQILEHLSAALRISPNGKVYLRVSIMTTVFVGNLPLQWLKRSSREGPTKSTTYFFWKLAVLYWVLVLQIAHKAKKIKASEGKNAMKPFFRCFLTASTSPMLNFASSPPFFSTSAFQRASQFGNSNLIFTIIQSTRIFSLFW